MHGEDSSDPDGGRNDDDQAEAIHSALVWRDNGWTASVIDNEDDDGWAVAMTRDGENEPSLVGPWTMGRDKRNPKPLDGAAFITLVKTASEFVRRREQQQHALLHQSVTVAQGTEQVTVRLDIVPDEDEPYATLSAQDAMGELLAEVKVSAGYRLNRNSASAWVSGGYRRPREG